MRRPESRTASVDQCGSRVERGAGADWRCGRRRLWPGREATST